MWQCLANRRKSGKYVAPRVKILLLNSLLLFTRRINGYLAIGRVAYLKVLNPWSPALAWPGLQVKLCNGLAV